MLGFVLGETAVIDVDASSFANVADTIGIVPRDHRRHSPCKAINTTFTLCRTFVPLLCGWVLLSLVHWSSHLLVRTFRRRFASKRLVGYVLKERRICHRSNDS